MIMQETNKKLSIISDTKVRDVQTEFELLYPFLKIEFAKRGSEIFSESQKINPDALLSRFSNLPMSVVVNVDEERTIAEVEKDCMALLGLTVQICRKSGNVCNAISLTNNWTLQSQNAAGEFISTEMQKAS